MISRTAAKRFERLDDHHRDEVVRAITRLHETGIAQKLSVSNKAKAVGATHTIRANHATRVVLTKKAGQWVVLDIVRRGDKKLYKTE